MAHSWLLTSFAGHMTLAHGVSLSDPWWVFFLSVKSRGMGKGSWVGRMSCSSHYPFLSKLAICSEALGRAESPGHCLGGDMRGGPAGLCPLPACHACLAPAPAAWVALWVRLQPDPGDLVAREGWALALPAKRRLCVRGSEPALLFS